MDPSAIIDTYICAKDCNRPWLMPAAFAADAVLKMDVNTEAITFPASTRGIADMTDILVRSFARDYENVYTVCLADPPAPDAVSFNCRWLVAMSDKKSRHVRVGCGQYDWVFGMGENVLATQLTITIDHMQVLNPAHLDTVMSWISALPYPWCSPEQAVRRVPQLTELEEIARYIALNE